MYRINIKSRGKYNNVITGYRYTFTKNSAKNLIELMTEMGCEFEVEKFTHLAQGVFSWTKPITF